MTRLLLSLSLLALCLFTVGCGSLLSGVKVESTKTVAKKPGNVVLYLAVEDGGKPVDQLTTSNFEIYENDVLLNKSGLHLELLPRDTAAVGHTVLLLDLSGEISEADLRRISRGAAHFIDKVTTTQAVTLLVFDGSEKPRLVARFPQVTQEEAPTVPDLTPFVTGDDSRNLNGAIIFAMQTLKRELAQTTRPAKRGTLVTLARGPDLAERKSDDELYDALRDSDYEFYALEPENAQIPTIGSFGADGRLEYDTIDTLPLRMVDLGMDVRGAWKRHYILSYCSPARGGTRDVKVVVRFSNDRGDQRTGKARTGFDAGDFGPGCGPLRPVLQARKDAIQKEKLAQEQADAEAAEERRRAEEADEARRAAEESSRKARAARAAARRSIEGAPVQSPEDGDDGATDSPADADDEPEEVIAPPSSGGYE